MKTMLPLLAVAILSILPLLAICISPCPPCGNLSVPYPLSTSPSCGDPRYKLYCKNKVLEFRSVGRNSYKVLSIDPASARFVISPPSIDPNSCISSDLLDGGLQIDEKSPFNISNRNTLLLFNCSDLLLLSPFVGSLRGLTMGPAAVKHFVAATWRTPRHCHAESGLEPEFALHTQVSLISMRTKSHRHGTLGLSCNGCRWPSLFCPLSLFFGSNNFLAYSWRLYAFRIAYGLNNRCSVMFHVDPLSPFLYQKSIYQNFL